MLSIMRPILRDASYRVSGWLRLVRVYPGGVRRRSLQGTEFGGKGKSPALATYKPNERENRAIVIITSNTNHNNNHIVLD